MDETLVPFFADPTGLFSPFPLEDAPLEDAPLEDAPPSDDFEEVVSEEEVDSVAEDSEEPPFPFGAGSIVLRA
ncbi:MAG: hypothetical protein ACYC5Q_15170 [Thermoleophilia bacterium]